MATFHCACEFAMQLFNPLGLRCLTVVVLLDFRTLYVRYLTEKYNPRKSTILTLPGSEQSKGKDKCRVVR